MALAIALAAGTMVGALPGLVGAGGSILAVPALVYGAGLPLREAMITGLVVVLASSITALVPRLRSGIDWATAALMGVSGIPFAFVGNVIGRQISDTVLSLVFSVTMLAAAALMLRKPQGRRERCVPQGSGAWGHTIARGVAAGAGVGTLTGLLGVGGGFLIVPVLTLILGLPMSLAVGTSLAVIAINSTAGLVSHLQGAHIDWALALSFAAATVVASTIASRIGLTMSEEVLRRAFCTVVMMVSAFMAVNAVQF